MKRQEANIHGQETCACHRIQTDVVGLSMQLAPVSKHMPFRRPLPLSVDRSPVRTAVVSPLQ